MAVTPSLARGYLTRSLKKVSTYTIYPYILQEVGPIVKSEPDSHSEPYTSVVETMEEGFADDGGFAYEEYEEDQYGYEEAQEVDVNKGQV